MLPQGMHSSEPEEIEETGGFAQDERGMLETGKALAIVGVVIGAVVTALVLAAVAPEFFGAVADLNAVFTNESTTTGDATADSLLSVFPIIIGITGLFAIAGLAIVAFRLRGTR